ncbi:glycoside hydrolase family protein [Methylobacterium pseudosasicola]|uniref:Lysozyme n=1 Tax=Methylobacterium pseudosasicola TaxID=582667 RepID=A0A1I4QN91_9HYPH|nr:hypothetical protein [Methylobacterium pseudosasicola]SFM41507.1 hypothetical protein SAMN05192568_103080 [Methylobacterium pseudosasicola]
MNLACLFRAFRGPAAAAVIATAHPVVAVPIQVTTIEAVAPGPASKGKTCFIAGTLFATLCCTRITGFEGMRTKAYRDGGGVPTVCVGETKGARMGMKFTIAEC